MALCYCNDNIVLERPAAKYVGPTKFAVNVSPSPSGVVIHG